MPIAEVEARLGGLEAQPRVIREVLLARITQAWLDAPESLHHLIGRR
jgi:hypothetical protein